MANSADDAARFIMGAFGACDTLTDAELKSVGELGQSIVLTRTKLSKEVGGAGFKSYTEPYKNVRKRRGLSADRPDLVVTGKMLGDIAPFPRERNVVQIEFQTAEQDAKARGNSHKRPFMDITQPREKELIESEIRELFEAKFKKYFAR